MKLRLGLYAAVLLLALTVWAARSSADSGLRCQDRLISIGFTQYDVSSLCGPPDSVTQRIEPRRVRRPIAVPCPGSPRGMCTSVIDDVVDVPIDEWVYDFGTQRFIQYLTFESGQLVRMHAGGYGHKSL